MRETTSTTTRSELRDETRGDRVSTPTSLGSDQQDHTFLVSPWAILFLVLSSTSVIGCILVVYLANRRVISHWMPRTPAVQPTVLLTVLTSVFSFTNKGVFLARVAVVWWRAASNSTTLATLHYIWDRGKGTGLTDTWKEIKRAGSVRKVAIAFAVVTVVDLWDGALLQRSIKPVNAVHSRVYLQEAWLPPVIPDRWYGTVDQNDSGGFNISGEFVNAWHEWYREENL